MVFLMLIALYTSRVVLNSLGVTDYGIYNVVGGFVAMFSMISGTLSTAISRFLTLELGKGNTPRLRNVFSSAVTIQIGLGLIVILLGETIGLWFLRNEMFIPSNRHVAAFWVFQLSLLTFSINLISIPYNAAIVAFEKMGVFAYISIIEGTLKLIIAFMILKNPFDRLIYYSILMTGIALIVRLLYGVYCKKAFKECSYKFVYDKILLKKMFGFAGWNFIGNGSAILNGQGINVLMNMFFGVAVNTSRGIATQVENVITSFIQNFMTALSPQITKSYAVGNMEYMRSLIYNGAKYSYFLMLIISLPILFETHYILKLWLGTAPPLATTFGQLAIISGVINLTTNTLYMGIMASGIIRNYQIVAGVVSLTVFPLTYFLYKTGLSPEWAYFAYIIVYLILIYVRLYLVKDVLGITIKDFSKKVLMKDMLVTATALLIPVTIHCALQPSIYRFILSTIICFLCSIISIWSIGISKSERVTIMNIIKKRHL